MGAVMFYGGSGVGITGTANLAYNTTTNQIEFNRQITAGALTLSPEANSSGTTGSYTYYVCTQNTTITPSSTISNVKYFMVGGGGGGASNISGGGGAGGLLTNDSLLSEIILESQYDSGGLLTLTGSTAYTVTIGQGGAGAATNSVSGSNGTSTVFAVSGGATLATAVGGGGGITYLNTPVNGGCGGGGGSGGEAGAVGTQGYNGGFGGAGVAGFIGGGGGGIMGVGGNYSGVIGGAGGPGLQYYANGGRYGAGGGGSSLADGTGFGNGIGGPGGSAGGVMIGGTGGAVNGGVASPGIVGAINTGSGGGGGPSNPGPTYGATGAAGVFILLIPTPGAPVSTNFANIGLTEMANNLIISATDSIVMSAGAGSTGLSMTNLASVASATPSGFYRMLYNPTTGQIVYGSDLSP